MPDLLRLLAVIGNHGIELVINLETGYDDGLSFVASGNVSVGNFSCIITIFAYTDAILQLLVPSLLLFTFLVTGLDCFTTILRL